MVAATVVPLSEKSDSLFVDYYRNVQNLQNITRSDFRSRLERIDRLYQREVDVTKDQREAKKANLSGDPSRFQNIIVPVVAPQVETATTHQASVYLSGYPIFGVVSDPQFIDEALQLESILEDNSIRGGWARELMMFFRDGFKHNFSAIEVDWADEVTYSIETNIKSNVKDGTPKEVIWSGNKLRRLDPYNTFIDTRVIPTEVYKDGDFAGYTRAMTRIQLKSFVATLPSKILRNIKPAFESGRGASATGVNSTGMDYYVPDINPIVTDDRNMRGGTNWLLWAGLNKVTTKIDYKDSYEVSIMYCRILPGEFRLANPKSATPQIYKLIIVNHQHIIYAELQTNAHGYLPILIGQPLEDGLGYQTKSLADNAAPFQDVTSAYMNSIIASKRRSISDRVLYDPSRITSAQINNVNPSAKIPVRPAAYGKNISDAVFQFPYKEDQNANSMQQIQALVGLSNQLAGQNQVSQGQFVKGNKTRREVDEVLENAGGRDQMASILLESQVFTPMKTIFKSNTLQFQAGVTLYNRDRKQLVEIDPVALRKAVVEFKISDGLTPSAKIISADVFDVAIQTIASSPQISQAYNIAPMFSYMMKTQGAKISDFEKSQEQVTYEQALAAWNSNAQLLIEKGGDISQLPPQPLPEQFGFKPASNTPSAPAEDTQDTLA